MLPSRVHGRASSAESFSTIFKKVKNGVGFLGREGNNPLPTSYWVWVSPDCPKVFHFSRRSRTGVGFLVREGNNPSPAGTWSGWGLYAPQRGSGQSPDCPKLLHYFQEGQGGVLRERGQQPPPHQLLGLGEPQPPKGFPIFSLGMASPDS